MEYFFNFYQRAIPSFQQFFIISIIALLFIMLAVGVTGYIKKQRKWATAYTRKVFHFMIFTSAAIFHGIYGLKGVVIFGMLVALTVLGAVWWREHFIFYEALARPTDAPHRTLFIIIPLFTTALGGMTVNILFPKLAYLAYLISGWADAIAEPVGQKWGANSYRVPSLADVPAERTIEGSMAIAFTTFFISSIYLIIKGFPVFPMMLWASLLAIIVTFTEAISHHGLDNFTVQVVVPAFFYFVVG